MGRAPRVCQFLFLKKEFLVFLRAPFFPVLVSTVTIFWRESAENNYSIHMTGE